MEKPFYISQLPEKTQAWIKEKTKENFLKDGMSEEEAEQKATDFLDEKVNVAEEFFGKDFYKSIDAIKDNFTPPGAKGEKKRRIIATDNPNWKWDNEDIARRFMAIPLVGGAYENNDPETAKEYYKQLKKMPIEELVNERDLANTMRFEGEDEPEWAKEKDNEVLNPTYSSLFGSDAPYSNMESILDEWDKEDIDTNDNGKIEVDEMADFQKSLDDYASKNKKGRDDIPVTTRR